MAFVKVCDKCGGRVGPKNKIGLCRPCMYAGGFAVIKTRDPEAFERARVEGMKRRYREDPQFKAEARERLLKAAKLPHAVAARKASGRRLGLSGLGAAATASGTEARAKQGRTCSERRLAWCPPELRKDYLHLLRAKRMKKEEAREIILAQHEADIRRVRAKMGVEGPVELPKLPDFVPVGEPTIRYDRVEAARAERERIESLRQRRTLCPICGARSDIGCEHGVAA